MSGNAESIGSLIIDLRANVAQLRVDMDEVKNTVAKSSREMSSQMKQDMAETRQVLALMRDDFGIGIPRELRKAIAGVEGLRTVVLTLSNAFYALGFINLGLEAIKKVYEAVEGASKAAEEEAKHTREIALEAEKAVQATENRKFALELIGKGEEERAKLEKQHFDEEMNRAKLRLASLQAELAAKLAIVNLSLQTDIYDPGTGGAVGKTGEYDQSEYGTANRNTALKKFNEENKEAFKQIQELQKAMEEGMKGEKEGADRLFLHEQGLSLARLKSSQQLALSDVELKKDTVQKMYEAGKIGLDQELLGLRTAATKKYNINLKELQDSLSILEQDPGRNQQKILETQTQIALLWKAYEKELTDIKYQGVIARTKLAQEELAMDAGVARALIDSNKLVKPSTLSASSGGAPKLSPDVAGAAVDRFRAGFKDAAAQGKLLEQAMDDLLKPMDKFRIEQQEIDILKEKFKDYPTVIQALNVELLKANPEFQKLMAASAEFGKDLSNELDNLILKGENFSDFLKNIAKDIEEIALKALLLKPLEDFFSGGSSGTGGIFSSLGKLFSGLGFADGGSPPSGQFSLVGENGPELFMPHSAGTIVPNSSLGGVTNVFQIDARGAAPGSEAAIIRGIQRALEQNVTKSVAAGRDFQRRR